MGLGLCHLQSLSCHPHPQVPCLSPMLISTFPKLRTCFWLNHGSHRALLCYSQRGCIRTQASSLVPGSFQLAGSFHISGCG